MATLILVVLAFFLWWLVLPLAGVFLFVYVGLMFVSFVFSLFDSPKSKIDEIVENAKKTKSKEELKYPYLH